MSNKYSNNILLLILVTLLLSIFIQIGNIQKSNENVVVAIPDTIIKTITKTKTVTVNANNKLIYIDGSLYGKTYKLVDKFKYDPKYPKVIYNGYITKIKDRSGAKYYFWSEDGKNEPNEVVDGWYFTDSGSKFQELDPTNPSDPDYMEIIYKIVSDNVN